MESNEPNRFDELTRVLAAPTSRRQALKAFAATAVGALFGGAALDAGRGEALAANCKGTGGNCNTASQCCSRNCNKGICCATGYTNCGSPPPTPGPGGQGGFGGPGGPGGFGGPGGPGGFGGPGFRNFPPR